MQGLKLRTDYSKSQRQLNRIPAHHADGDWGRCDDNVMAHTTILQQHF
jgi:hypothetical protein